MKGQFSTILYMRDDFDAELPDSFWPGEEEN